MPNADNWYTLTTDESLKSLGSGLDGLTSEEAAKRLKEYGPNELRRLKKISPWAIFFEQFKDLLIIILLVAVVISAVLGETVDAIVIFIIIVFAAGLGFIQEYRAERSLEALKKMAAPAARVTRDGKHIDIPAVDLVPGDVVLLKTGDRIPADGRVLESVNLRTDEASLTGESSPVEKHADPIPSGSAVADRLNMVFAGTSASYGRGTAVITSTGMETEFGKIASLLQEVKEEETPLQVNLDHMGRIIIYAALGLTFVLAVLGVLRGHSVAEMFLWGVSLAVAAVPEALPAVVTISLSLGVQKMAKRHALVRKLPAVETLGSTTYICSDKTGTLTQDQMTVREVLVDLKQIEVSGSGYEPKGDFTAGGKPVTISSMPSLQRLLIAGVLCNDTELSNETGAWCVKGDPTEGALLVLAGKAGLDIHEIAAGNPRIHEIPFSSESKRMTTVHTTASGDTAMAKGAAEVILDCSRYVLINDREVDLDDAKREAVLAATRRMADSALRVLGLAYNKVYAGETDADIQKNMVFLGLVGMIDPPRPEVKEAIKLCDAAGIRIVMITGDYPATAQSIARQAGLASPEKIITGPELERMSDEELAKQIKDVQVFARVVPEQKLRIVMALKANREIVAMTGDGVNDAPALKAAHIGIAMGGRGTDVAREAASLVLLDDDFSSIVAAVRLGRRIYDNIKKAIAFTFAVHVPIAGLSMLPVFFSGWPLLLFPVHIVFLELIIDPSCSLVFEAEEAEANVMERPPRSASERLFSFATVGWAVLEGLSVLAVCLGVFLFSRTSQQPDAARALTFLTLVVSVLVIILANRSWTRSIVSMMRVPNTALWWVLGGATTFLALVLFVPAAQGLFHFAPLRAGDMALSFAAGVACMMWFELLKLSKWRKSAHGVLHP